MKKLVNEVPEFRGDRKSSSCPLLTGAVCQLVTSSAVVDTVSARLGLLAFQTRLCQSFDVCEQASVSIS